MAVPTKIESKVLSGREKLALMIGLKWFWGSGESDTIDPNLNPIIKLR